MGYDQSEIIGGIMIAVASGVVMAVAALLVAYKTIDGDIPVWAGLGGLIGIIGVLALAVKPPHPAVPGVILVVALTLMAFFPFVHNQLEKSELLGYDISRLERAFASLREHPDNFASKLEVAQTLWSQGFAHHAIAIGNATLSSIPEERDIVTNRSLRDSFRGEDYKVRQWMRTVGNTPLYAEHMKCRACNHENPVSAIVCEKCGNAYLLDAAKRGDNKPKVIGKLVFAWGLLALFLVGSASIGLHFQGVAGIVMFVVALIGLGLALHFLFRRTMATP